MLKSYPNISPRRFHRIFTTIAPCECHIEDFDTLYNVKIVFDDKTSLAKSVTINCSSCGSNATFDVAGYNKHKEDVVFGARKTK